MGKKKRDYPWQRKRRRSIIYFVVIPGILLSAMVFYRTKIDQQIATREAALLSIVEPLTREDFENGYQAPAPENVAALHEALLAIKLVTPETLTEQDKYHIKAFGANMIRSNARFQAPQLAALQKVIQSNTHIVEQLTTLIERNPVQDWNTLQCAAPKNFVSHLNNLKLYLLRELAVSQKNPEADRIFLILDSLAFLEKCELFSTVSLGLIPSTPVLNRQILCEVLSTLQLTPAQLRHLRQSYTLPRLEPGIAQRYLVRDLLQSESYFEVPPPSGGDDIGRKIAQAFYAIGHTQNDFSQFLSFFLRVAEMAEKFDNGVPLSDMDDFPRYNLLAVPFAPRTQQAIRFATREIKRYPGFFATLHSADLVLAVELYRAEHQTLPEDLESLVPEYLQKVPQDPYDGQPMRYVKKGENYLVYSVGANMHDDGGAISNSFYSYDRDIGIRMVHKPIH